MRLILFGALLVSGLLCTAYGESLTVEKSDSVTLLRHNPEKRAAEEPSAMERLLVRAKRRSGGQWTTQQIIECIFAIFIPPVAVLIHGGHEWVLHLVINIILWILGWIPGTIHALWYCFFR